MATKTLPPQAVLLQLLQYDPETGKLYWRERGLEWFASGRYSADRNAAIWNTRFAGKEAFFSLDGHGYPMGSVLGEPYRAHRVIWKMITGEEPAMIDHINGDRADNRLQNLRPATHAENLRNCRMSKNNTSGANGVRLDDKTGLWHAQIMVNYKTINLGLFPSRDEAIAARQNANSRFGFSQGHGELRATR